MDPLTILITGDVSGMETAMKKALNIVMGGVNKMNEQEVDWTGIFSRAVSPAIISGVASVFAFAIANAVNFQAAMNGIGTAAGLNTTQIAQMGAASQSLANQTGQNSNDIGQAFGAVAPVFADTAVQQAFVADATQLASSGFGNLSDIVSAALPIMQQFGVTTTAQVNQVFTELMHGAEGSGESLSSFAGQFSQVIPTLIEGGAKLSDLNNLLSGFAAEISSVGVTEATASFQTFGTAVSGTDIPLNAFVGSSATLLSILRNQGLPAAMAEMGDKIEASGKSAAFLYSSLGVVPAAFDGLTQSAQRLPTIAADAKRIADNSQSIADAFNQSDSAVREFGKDYQKVLGLFTNDAAVTTFFTGLAEGIGLVLDAEKWLIDHSGDLITAVTSPWAEMTTIIEKLPTLIQSIFSGGGLSKITGGIESIFGDLFGSSNGSLSTALSSAGGKNFSSAQISSIDTQAGNSSMIQSLISALSTGVKQGQYTSLVNTFHLTVPPGSVGLTAKQIAAQLYTQFNGT